MKRFEQTLERIDRMLASMTNRVDLIRSLYENRCMQPCYVQTLRLEENAERLVLQARSLPVYTGSRSAIDEVAQIIQDVIPMEMGFTEEGWFCLRIPMLLPKKESGSVNWLRGFLYPAMSRFFMGKQPVRYPDCVLIYRHVYARDCPERQWRDHDNIEINFVTDAVALYLMPDDNPTVCRHYYCSASGDQERTEVYVVPRDEFICWLESEESIPEDSKILYEIRPDSTEKHT